jgi:PadR family transcriptional regulator, regulatory protein PadR
MNIHDKFNPIRKGLLELVVLKVIAAHKVYAADIIRQLTETDFATQEGTLYPLLSRLRREGAVTYEWAESDAGPPRKYYQLTEQGRTQLFQLEQYWVKLSDTLDKLGEST